MARQTIERWLADIWPTKETRHKADMADRRRDQKVGAQMRISSDKTPETNWRALMKRKER